MTKLTLKLISRTATPCQLTVLLLTTIWVTAPTQAGDDYYTWVDENGVVNFSERQPPGHQAQPVSEKGDETPQRFGYKPRQRVPDPQQTETDPTEEQDEVEEAVDPALAAENDAEERRYQRELAEYCRATRESLERLESNARIRVDGENGESRFLSEDEIDSRKRAAATVLRKSC